MKSLAELQELESKYVIGTYRRAPVQFVRGQGALLWDSEGAEYIDLLAGISVLNVGHSNPRVVAAIQAQAGILAHVSNLFYTENLMVLAQRLSESSLGGKVFFCNSGAEANEAAIKLARRARPGGEIVVLRDAFHGRTMGALSATPQEAKQAPFAPLVPGFRPVAKDVDALRAAVGEQTAAVMLEVIQGEGGVIPLDDELLVAARAACDESGAALIIDEVQTGMMRTGTLWGYQGTPIVPDAITVAKALGGGLPIGALITGPKPADVFQPGDHASTFGGGPLVCAAALAAFEILSDPKLAAQVSELGERMAIGLAELPYVDHVRGRGLLIGAVLRDGVDAVALAERALTEQHLVLNAVSPSVLRIEPPLTISVAEIDTALARLAALG